MSRWLQRLKEGGCRKRPAAELQHQTIQELEAYDDWGREHLRFAPDLTYRGLQRLLGAEHEVTAADGTTRQRLLESEHQVTGVGDTNQRWLVILREGRPCYPRYRKDELWRTPCA